MNMKASPLNLVELLRATKGMFLYHHHGRGLTCLVLTLCFLSLCASLELGTRPDLYLAGEIAASEVLADRNLLVEDAQATQTRREQATASQPQIFDLDRESVARFRDDTLNLLLDLASRGIDGGGLELIRAQFNEKYGTELTEESFRPFATAKLQAYVSSNALPWLERHLNDGVLADMRQISASQNALLMRDPASGVESLRSPSSGTIHDLRSLTVALGQYLRMELELRPMERTVLMEVLPVLLLPTLVLNKEATQQRNTEMVRIMEPTLYRVHKGEVVVRPGDVVSHEQQLKIQSLYSSTPALLDFQLFIGLFFTSLFLGLSLYMTPTFTKGTVLQAKDLYFISLLLLVFGLMALALSKLDVASEYASTATLFYALPLAGAAGLSALIFSARRYCGIGLLLSLICTAMLHGDLALFLFFFLSAMCNTWLVLRAQNRQDMVWSGLPLFLWMLTTALAASCFGNINLTQIPVLVLMVACSTLFSVFLLFALSPFLEMALGYTTRFRLMELMNLEQPLLQEMMMTIPGTYHHSLVVSNLVEAGAKAVGANSLLCKVGALYHDIGKLSHPQYYIENQFGGPNPHDKLSPAMSALILSSHIKRGIELAEEHKLGQELSDIIGQHHGSREMYFFYKKALDAGENPREEDYSYPGPRPQSREAAIVMVADAVEASSRTLADPTPARIRSHVDNIIKGIFVEGQLDESDLTFQDLSKLSDSFARIVTGLFHQRIAYPDRKEKEPVVFKNPEKKSDGPKPDGSVENSQAHAHVEANGQHGKHHAPKPDAQAPQPGHATVPPAQAAALRPKLPPLEEADEA